MRTAADIEPDPWRANYIDAETWACVDLGRVAADASELSRLVNCPQKTLVGRLAFAHVHGRLRLERLSPSRSGDERGPRGVSMALATDLAELARRDGIAADAYIRAALSVELQGVLGADAGAEAAAWRDDDASLKVWLPAAVSAAVADLARIWEVSAGDVVRNALFMHLYGLLGFWRAVRARTWTSCRRDASADVPAFSRRQQEPSEAPRTQAVRAQGKSDTGLRLWCPEPMKRRVQALAAASGRPTSEYMRQVVAVAACGRVASPS